MDARLREFERQCMQGDLEACHRAFKEHKRVGTPLENMPSQVLDIGTKIEMEVQESVDFRELINRGKGSPYSLGQFNAIRFNNGIRISIQASSGHYSSPREDLKDKYAYTSWEIMFYQPIRRKTFWDPEDHQEEIEAYQTDPNAEVIRDTADEEVEVIIHDPMFLPGGLLYGCPRQDQLEGRDSVNGWVPTAAIQDIVDFCRARFGLKEQPKMNRRNPLDTSGIICDFCGKPDITHVYFTEPFMLGNIERSNFASCNSCAKSIDNRNITALVNRAVRLMPQNARRQAKGHFNNLYRTFFINLITKRRITPADIFDLQTARATAQHQKCEVRSGHPTLGECADIALLEVAVSPREGQMLHAADAGYDVPEDAVWKPSCVVCASGILGLEKAEDIVGHPALRTLGSRRRNPDPYESASHGICVSCYTEMTGKEPPPGVYEKQRQERLQHGITVYCGWCKKPLFDPDEEDEDIEFRSW